MRAALEIASRYAELSYSFNQFGFEINTDRVRVFFGDEDNPVDLRGALVERDVAALIALQQGSLWAPLPIRAMHLKASRPAYAQVFEPLFGVRPEWSSAENVVELDLTCLEEVGQLADDFGRDLCEEQCRVLLERRRDQCGLAGRVRSRLFRAGGRFPSMPAVAAELAMSTRTLRNQLAREGTNYRTLTNEARKVLAEQLLSSGKVPIGAIAERLGYADRSAFITAFKRWKGVSPSEYRSSSGS